MDTQNPTNAPSLFEYLDDVRVNLEEVLDKIGYPAKDKESFIRKFFAIAETKAITRMVNRLPDKVAADTSTALTLLNATEDEKTAAKIMLQTYQTIEKHLSAKEISLIYREVAEDLFQSYISSMQSAGVEI